VTTLRIVGGGRRRNLRTGTTRRSSHGIRRTWARRRDTDRAAAADWILVIPSGAGRDTAATELRDRTALGQWTPVDLAAVETLLTVSCDRRADTTDAAGESNRNR
jgi:hypothetical protein